MRSLVLLALLALGLAADQLPVAKRLAGPVFKDGQQRSLSILDPPHAPRRGGTAMWLLDSGDANRVSERLPLPPSAKRVSVLSSAAYPVDITLGDEPAPEGPQHSKRGHKPSDARRARPLAEVAAAVRTEHFERGSSRTRLEQYDFVPMPIDIQGHHFAVRAGGPPGSSVLVVLEDGSRLELLLRYGHDRFVEGRDLPVELELAVAGGAEATAAERAAIEAAGARLFVRRGVTGGEDDGPEEELPLQRAAAGHWRGSLRIAAAGRHELRAHASAPREAERTVADAIHAAAASVRVDRRPQALVTRDPRHPELYAQVDVPVECRDAAACGPFELYAELWGEQPDPVPVAWFGGIASPLPCGEPSPDPFMPKAHGGKPPLCIRGYVHFGWLGLASGPWETAGLRNVRLRDTETHATVAEADGATLRDDEGLLQARRRGLLGGILGLGGERKGPTLEMEEGPKPAKKVRRANLDNSTTPARAMGVAPSDFVPQHTLTALIVAHGYCADGSDWYMNNFTDAVRFMDYGQGVSNDEFARRLSVFGSGQASCAVAAHSQGGLAALHMRNFYHSCLDGTVNRTDGARLIQTVGSPFHGSSIAGRWASIFGLIGYGCGSVADLTPAGAELWLSYMRDEARRDVSYFATRSPAGGLPCDRRTDLLLLKPNDGATENVYNELVGANPMPITDGECHMDLMNYPSQTLNGSRNVDISAHAARVPIPRVIRSDYLGLILGVMLGLILVSTAVGLAVRWYRLRYPTPDEDLENAGLPAGLSTERTPLLSGASAPAGK